MILSTELVKAILDTVDHGLSRGLGKPVPGGMCVEAAVNYAMGRPHGDDPGCVGSAVRHFKITLNDALWLSSNTRANGMRKLAVAQIGSNTIDQYEFVKLILLGTVQKVLPFTIRRIGLESLEKHAVACENVTDIKQILSTVNAALTSVQETANVYVHDDHIYNASAKCASSISYARNAVNELSEPALPIECVITAKICARAARCAVYGPVGHLAGTDDEVLLISADVALKALIELKSPGCEYLYLC